MDIDFHFDTVYVLARWAGFSHENSRTLAITSQFVDDNAPDTVQDAPRYSGHDITENLTDLSHNDEIWIPFHFLPGLEGEGDKRLICKKNSSIANNMASNMKQLTNTGDNVNFFRLGISLHVYADTWAHQEFSGILSKEDNTVSQVSVLYPKNQDIGNDTNYLIAQLPALGHAKAGHWPDAPYVYWRCVPTYVNGRKNWEEFLEAASSIYGILSVLQGHPEDINLSTEQKNQLEHAFKTINVGDYNVRHLIWLDRIKTGYFGFYDAFSEEEIPYSIGYILNDPDFFRAFYQALEDHYNWVKHELETNGIYQLS